MDYNKARNIKDPIIELSLDCEEKKLEIDIGTPRPTYVQMVLQLALEVTSGLQQR
jgi:hypothetical protein